MTQGHTHGKQWTQDLNLGSLLLGGKGAGVQNGLQAGKAQATGFRQSNGGVGGRGDAWGVWDGNAIKLDCHDHCTTINVTKFIE